VKRKLLKHEDKQKAKAPKVTLKIPCADPKCEEKKNEPFEVIPAITVTILCLVVPKVVVRLK
jgi:hypothetical protein